MSKQQTNSTEQTNIAVKTSLKDVIAEEAAQWLVTLRASTFRADDPYRDIATRSAAFASWIRQSTAHLLLFMELIEMERRLKRLDEAALAEIRAVIQELHSERDP